MRLCYLLFFAAALISCTPQYLPNLRNAPAFTKGGEFQGSAQILNGFAAQLAGSVTNHIAFMANFSSGQRSTGSSGYAKFQFLEGGLGVYKKWDRFNVNIFAGYGEGESEATIPLSNTKQHRMIAKFDRYFVQPSLSWYFPALTISFVNRVSFLDVTEYKEKITSEDYFVGNRIYYEPAVFVNACFLDNRAFMTAQGGVTVATKRTPYYFEAQKISFGIGVGFRLGGLREFYDRTNQ